MSEPILQNSLDVGCGVVIAGKRWLVKSANFETNQNNDEIGLFLELVPWESIDPSLYRLKPKRRRKSKANQSNP